MGLLAIAAGVAGAKIATKAIGKAVSVSSTIIENRKSERVKFDDDTTFNNPYVKVTVKCIGCRAYITDYPNNLVRCEYCDIEQTVNQKQEA